MKWELVFQFNNFEPLTEGIIQTMNYIDYPTQKDQISERLDDPMELGVCCR